MTDTGQPSALTLDDVRARFLAAEDHLSKASKSLGELQSAIQSLGAARDGLKQAGAEIARLSTAFRGSIEALNQNLGTLREGVDALKQGEPAEVLRQIGTLDRALHSSHAALLDRVNVVGQRLDAALAEQRAAGEARERAVAGLRIELIEALNNHGQDLLALDSRGQRLEGVLKAGDQTQSKRQGELRALAASVRTEARLFFSLTIVALVTVAAIVWLKP